MESSAALKIHFPITKARLEVVFPNLKTKNKKRQTGKRTDRGRGGSKGGEAWSCVLVEFLRESGDARANKTDITTE